MACDCVRFYEKIVNVAMATPPIFSLIFLVSVHNPVSSVQCNMYSLVYSALIRKSCYQNGEMSEFIEDEILRGILPIISYTYNAQIS